MPRHGQAVFDLAPATFRQLAQAAADARGDGWRVPIPSELLPPEAWVTDEKRARYVARLRDQPLSTFAEPLQITGAIDSLRCAFVRCTGGDLGHDLGGDPIAPMAARARREGWLYRELLAPHDPQLTDPIGTATALHDLTAAQIEPGRP